MLYNDKNNYIEILFELFIGDIEGCCKANLIVSFTTALFVGYAIIKLTMVIYKLKTKIGDFKNEKCRYK